MTNTQSELLPEYRVIFLWDDNKTDRADNTSLDWMINVMRLTDDDLVSRFVYDAKNPDYVIASDKSLTDPKTNRALRHYLKRNKESIFIFFTYEYWEPDFNIFDYAITWNPDLIYGDRVIRNIPYIYLPYTCTTPYTGVGFEDYPLRNTFTREEARKKLDSSPRFCDFIYSNRTCQIRNDMFHILSRYKRVDSFGDHLNNTGTQATRAADDWYGLSIKLKSSSKFSIAMENAPGKGYTSEKLISSLQAHTVPIYWGDPNVTEFINPKAIINVRDYASLEEIAERVKEIDNDDEQWLDIVTQPWQTEEQRARTLSVADDFNRQLRHIFAQNIHAARRRPTYKKFNSGFRGYVLPLHIRLLTKLRKILCKPFPRSWKLKVRELLHMQ